MRFLREMLQSEYGLNVEPAEPVMDVEHTFSHIHWNMRVYRCRFVSMTHEVGSHASELSLSDSDQGESADGGEFRWFGEQEIKQYAFPNVFVKILKHTGRL